MKKSFLLYLLLLSSILCAEPLKLLMVGNSYSTSLKGYLPKVTASVPGCELKLEIAYIGGCSLERHINQYEKSAANPEHKPYKDCSGKKVSLQELLKRDKWDIISIQQASGQSWRPESYQPWADKLIAIIKETNPQAEIIIQETWSYNAGDPHFLKDDPNGWNIDQTEMYKRLAENYRKLAKEKGFRLVPVGLAVAYSREDKPKQYDCLTKKERVAAFVYPAELPKTEDAVGNINWTKKKDNSGYELHVDTIHLNDYGRYLQACVWFSFLFKRPVNDITFYPPNLTDKQRIEKYRKCAARALAN